MESAETEIKLAELPIGARLIYRAKDEWRSAVIAKIEEQNVVLSISSPTGRNYRLRRAVDEIAVRSGNIAVLRSLHADSWKENFSIYDRRW